MMSHGKLQALQPPMPQREPMMPRPVALQTLTRTCHRRHVALAAVVLASGLSWGTAAQAGAGMLPPPGDELWPSLSARVTVQAAAVSPLKLSGWGALQPGELAGGAVLGDYVFAQPSFGSFRATSGLLFGYSGRVPQFGLASYAAGSRLGLALGQESHGLPARAENWQTTPYLGLGFSSGIGDSNFSLSADLGLLAEQAQAGASGSGLRLRAGDAQRRELRVSPLLQLGLRYSF